MFLKNLSIKMKLSLSVILVVLVLAVVVSFYSIDKFNDIVSEEERESLLAVGDFIKAQMDSELEAAKMSVLSIAHNTEVQRLFAERNREELQRRLLPAYKQISEEVAQVQFHLPDSTSFLRLHAPERYGDSLRDFRYTVNQANENQIKYSPSISFFKL